MFEACVMLILVPLVATAQGAKDESTDSRRPVPTHDEQEAADLLIRDIYAEEFGPPATPFRGAELARTLLKRSRELPTEPAMHFVLIELARDLALDAGDGATALAAVDEMGRDYRVDAEAMRLVLLERLAARAQDSLDYQLCIDEALYGVELAIRNCRWSGAAALLDFAGELAKKTDAPLVETTIDHSRARLHELQSGHDEYLGAMTVLANSPSDKDASKIVGRYRCFLLQDWEGGLQALLLSAEPRVSDLARLELKRPTNGTDQATIGDGWWDLAGSESEGSQIALRVHATEWYRRALPRIDGMIRVRVAARIAETNPPPPMPKEPIKPSPADWVIRRRIEDQWHSEPLDTTFHRMVGSVLKVRNTVVGSEIVKIAFNPSLLDGDFLVGLEYRGHLKTVELCAEDGADRQMYVEDFPIDSDWHRFTLTRTRGELRAWLDGLPVSVLAYNADPSLVAIFSIRIDPDSQLELRSFSCRVGAMR